MFRHLDGLSPGDPQEDRKRLQNVIDFWNALGFVSDAGETTWGVLEEIEAQVMECLTRHPPEINLAASLTARAACLMSGQDDF